MRISLRLLIASLFAGACVATCTAGEEIRFFKIKVVDDQTGRGVPLVELTTTNELTYLTDSNGIVAFFEPGLMGHEVYFSVRSHGYEFPADGFGFRGLKLKVTEGGSAVIKLTRRNVAERLYRLTGEGIYRDSVLVNEPVPLGQPLLNGQVTGQDSAHAVPYRGKIFWVWGDTNRPSYPLGNFAVSAATADWPAPRGTGLDPSHGVDFHYFVDRSGFSRPMITPDAIAGPGPKWLSGLVTLADPSGSERLIAQYSRMKNLGETYERGLAVFNDETERFERLTQFDLDAPLYLIGHPFRVTLPRSGAAPDARSAEFLYCGYSLPLTRVRADWKLVQDPTQYESFTCLSDGTRFAGMETQLDRDPSGALRYEWRRNTPALSFEQQRELVAARLMDPREGWWQMRDVDTGDLIKPHAASVRWNEFLRRWVAIVEQSGGTSFLGEIWLAAADSPIGPWVYARKVVTHNKYSFYNPVHHSFLDQDSGRLIYFEGTYAELFSGTPAKTPRYDYNQIMYRLALDDPRIALPAAVYRIQSSGGERYLFGHEVTIERAWAQMKDVAWYAVPGERAGAGFVPVFATVEGVRVKFEVSATQTDRPGRPHFWAIPADSDDALPHVAPLYEYRASDGSVTYSTDAALDDKSLRRGERPICRVWRNPSLHFSAADALARPAGTQR